MTACAAPLEVLEGILGCLDDDRAALSACSVACHAWLPIFRPPLFRKITLDYKGDSCDRLLRALRSSASTDVPIADCVREVKVCTDSVTMSMGRDDARKRLSRYAESMLGNWLQQPEPAPIRLPDGRVFPIGNKRALSSALGPVLHSLPHVEHLYMSSFDWNHLAPMTLWDVAMDRTCTSAPLSLFSGLTSVTSIAFGLTMFNSPSEVLQLLALFPNLKDLKMQAVICDPFGTDLPGCGTPQGWSTSSPICIEKLTIDGGIHVAPRLLDGLFSPPFTLTLRELSISGGGTCDFNTVVRLLNKVRSTIEIIRLDFSMLARMEKLLEVIDISKYLSLRVFELGYEYQLLELVLPGLGPVRDEAADIRHLPVFLRGLPESIEELVFRFKVPKRVTNGVMSIHWDFTDWDMLDRVFVELHARMPSLRVMFYFIIAPSSPLGWVTKSPEGLPDIAGALVGRLRRALARAMHIRVACIDDCNYDIDNVDIPKPVRLSLPQSD